jgi:hypothetical protein
VRLLRDLLVSLLPGLVVTALVYYVSADHLGVALLLGIFVAVGSLVALHRVERRQTGANPLNYHSGSGSFANVSGDNHGLVVGKIDVHQAPQPQFGWAPVSRDVVQEDGRFLSVFRVDITNGGSISRVYAAPVNAPSAVDANWRHSAPMTSVTMHSTNDGRIAAALHSPASPAEFMVYTTNPEPTMTPEFGSD